MYQPALFATRKRGIFKLLVIKVTDDLLKADIPLEITIVIEKMKKRFWVSNKAIDRNILFDRCETEQDHAANITISMRRYVKRMKSVHLSN